MKTFLFDNAEKHFLFTFLNMYNYGRKVLG